MKLLELSDIISVSEYEKNRDQRRKVAMALRARRLVQLGDKLALHFENQETLIYQIQEMMRVESMTSIDAVLGEIEVYNSMIPASGELSATLFIQLTSDADLRKWLPIFTALEGHLHLKIGAAKILAEFEPGRTREDKTASVHYIRFKLNAAQQKAFAASPSEFSCSLKEYQVNAPISEAMRKEFLSELA